MQGEVKDDDFRNYFEQFGEIDDCVVSLHCLLKRCLAIEIQALPHENFGGVGGGGASVS